MLTDAELRNLRLSALNAHSRWKNEIRMCDMVARDEWRILWPDQTVESSDPLVENLYAEALEDKTITAAAVPLQLRTVPTRGTRTDRGEKNAEKRRRVGLSYWHRSGERRFRQKMYRDWLHTGIMAASPWATGFVDTVGQGRPSNERFAYFQHVNPRHLYPLGWDSRGMLTAGMVMRRRRLIELISEWGATDTLAEVARRHAVKSHPLIDVWAEEIWYFDGTQWAVAVADSPAVDQFWMGASMGPPPESGEGSMILDWIVEPAAHLLGACPLKAIARTTIDDSPRGALIDIVPALRTAQNFMARILDDLNMAIYAPVVLDNVANPEEYGLGAVLVGDGQGQARIVRDRPPVNFEAQQTVNALLDQARRQAFEPAQRSGEAGASIVSAKGTISLMGTFNAELATMQGDGEQLMSEITSATAAMDEKWCPGLKQIHVYDSTGDILEDETYDPATLFKGDWRFIATYGDRTGLDEQAHLTKLAITRNMSGMSLRSFMRKSGMIDDVMDEETEIAIEKLTALWFDGVLPQQIQAGDTDALVKFIEKIDTDKKSVREAMFETVREGRIAAANEAGQFGAGQRADIVRMMRSMASGGIPGNAEGQPAADMALPPPDRRMLAEAAPGGTAA